MPTKEDGIPTDMRDLLIRLDQRVDDGFRNINTKLDEMNRRADGHEVRIRSLEDWRTEVKGNTKGLINAATIVKGVVAFIIGALGMFGLQIAIQNKHELDTKVVKTETLSVDRPSVAAGPHSE